MLYAIFAHSNHSLPLQTPLGQSPLQSLPAKLKIINFNLRRWQQKQACKWLIIDRNLPPVRILKSHSRLSFKEPPSLYLLSFSPHNSTSPFISHNYLPNSTHSIRFTRGRSNAVSLPSSTPFFSSSSSML
eukprot:c25377_g1_i9 orf=1086-1475(+)